MKIDLSLREAGVFNEILLRLQGLLVYDEDRKAILVLNKVLKQLAKVTADDPVGDTARTD